MLNLLQGRYNVIFSPLIDNLIEAFCCLPGVGRKSAQRMAFHLLERDRPGAEHLANSLLQAASQVAHCQRCRNLSEQSICHLCLTTSRHSHQLCIVESPADVAAIEQTSSFRGYYFVLMGRLSPLDGVGPEALGMDQLSKRLDEGEVTEVILATNPTVEGEATAHYIANLSKPYQIHVTRIAHGVPLGGELEYIDGGTLAHAFTGRMAMED